MWYSEPPKFWVNDSRNFFPDELNQYQSYSIPQEDYNQSDYTHEGITNQCLCASCLHANRDSYDYHWNPGETVQENSPQPSPCQYQPSPPPPVSYTTSHPSYYYPPPPPPYPHYTPPPYSPMYSSPHIQPYSLPPPTQSSSLSYSPPPPPQPTSAETVQSLLSDLAKIQHMCDELRTIIRQPYSSSILSFNQEEEKEKYEEVKEDDHEEVVVEEEEKAEVTFTEAYPDNINEELHVNKTLSIMKKENFDRVDLMLKRYKDDKEILTANRGFHDFIDWKPGGLHNARPPLAVEKENYQTQVPSIYYNHKSLHLQVRQTQSPIHLQVTSIYCMSSISSPSKEQTSISTVYIPTGTSTGIGFTIAPSTVSKFVPQLIQSGKIVRVALSVDIVPGILTNQLNVRNTALILLVMGNSLVALVGLLLPSRKVAGNIILGDSVVLVGENKMTKRYVRLHAGKAGNKEYLLRSSDNGSVVDTEKLNLTEQVLIEKFPVSVLMVKEYLKDPSKYDVVIAPVASTGYDLAASAIVEEKKEEAEKDQVGGEGGKLFMELASVVRKFEEEFFNFIWDPGASTFSSHKILLQQDVYEEITRFVSFVDHTPLLIPPFFLDFVQCRQIEIKLQSYRLCCCVIYVNKLQSTYLCKLATQEWPHIPKHEIAHNWVLNTTMIVDRNKIAVGDNLFEPYLFLDRDTDPAIVLLYHSFQGRAWVDFWVLEDFSSKVTRWYRTCLVNLGRVCNGVTASKKLLDLYTKGIVLMKINNEQIWFHSKKRTHKVAMILQFGHNDTHSFPSDLLHFNTRLAIKAGAFLLSGPLRISCNFRAKWELRIAMAEFIVYGWIILFCSSKRFGTNLVGEGDADAGAPGVEAFAMTKPAHRPSGHEEWFLGSPNFSMILRESRFKEIILF